jgi:hypothetical protein
MVGSGMAKDPARVVLEIESRVGSRTRLLFLEGRKQPVRIGSIEIGLRQELKQQFEESGAKR